jgi:Domain of unknown function (DUF4395)
MAMGSVLSFPNPVNDKAARVVATGVVALSVAYLASGWVPLLWVLLLGFAARVASGPTLSPLGQLATRVVAPRLGEPRWTPGPPKRFAQAIGLAFSIAAVVVEATAGVGWSKLVIAALAAAAGLEAGLGICLGCRIFAVLMRVGVIPATVCAECADVSLRHPELSRS